MKTGFLLSLLLGGVLVTTARAESLIRPIDRIVFVGDSITGQGENHQSGWVHLIRTALKGAYPNADPVCVVLGGSGQTVGSWLGIEKKSREEETILDVKGIDARKELDQPTDVLVIMLGMNDILCPRIKDTEEDLEKWASHYRELIHALRARATPRVLALAVPTLCTEDEASPKNVVMEKLVARLSKLASEEDAILLPTRQAMKEVLSEGRNRDTRFRVTTDDVHPNPAGHAAIAAGMLRGLGEAKAAQTVLEGWRKLLPTDPSLSYRIKHLGPANDAGGQRFEISYHWQTDPPSEEVQKAVLSLPEGWSIVSEGPEKFVVEGKPDHLENKLSLTLADKVTKIRIPAPWLIGVSRAHAQGWQGGDYHADEGKLEIDEQLVQGRGWLADMELAPGNQLAWQPYFASLNGTSDKDREVLDFAEMAFFDSFAVGYGARWIFAPSPAQISLRVTPLGFTKDNHLMVWLNGREIFAEDLKKASPQTFELSLQQGWNLFVFKSNHREWQWKFALDLQAANTSTLDALRFQITPP